MKNWYLKAQHYLDYSEREQDEEGEWTEIVIDSKSFEDTCYHGSYVEKDQDLFEDLNTDFTEWDAIWVTTEEYIAEEFGKNYFTADGPKNIPIVFKLHVKMEKVAQIYSLEVWKEIQEFYNLEPDLREAIDFLQQRGFNGWSTKGGIAGTKGGYSYDDIAVFSGAGITLQAVKVWANGKWTDYIDFEQAQQLINQVRRSSRNQK